MKLEQIITFTGTIFCVTGLSIGGSSNALEIGGVAQEVIKNPITKEPYIPGSSLKGKMRFELEKKYGSYFEKVIEDDKNKKSKKSGTDESHRKYLPSKNPCGCGRATCYICRIFGAHNNKKAMSGPTRIVVRDAVLSQESKETIHKLTVDHGGYLERKTENIINRNSGTADSPRTIERVPAGLSFEFEIVLRIFEGDNSKEMIEKVKEGLKLVEKSYLGGGGSRGSGQVKFEYEVTCENMKGVSKSV